MSGYKFVKAPKWVDMSLFKEAISRFRTEMVFYTELPDEPFDFRFKPKFNTACWSFAHGRHTVYLGLDIFKGCDTTLLKDREDGIAYLLRFLRHEVGHGLWTLDKERKSSRGVRGPGPVHAEMVAFQALLSKEKIPFSMWNLFEDSRIENHQRHRNKLSFNWQRFEKLDPKSLSAPGQVFFFMVQLEGKLTEIDSRIMAVARPELTALYHRVYDYYQRALKAPFTQDLVPLLREWVTEFPQYRERSSKTPIALGPAAPGGVLVPGAGFGSPEDLDGLQDLALSFEISVHDDKRAQFNSDALDETDLDSDDPQELPGELIELEPDGNTRQFNNRDMLTKPAGKNETVDGARVQRVLAKFAAFRQNSSVKRFSELPSKRLNMIREIRELPSYVRIVQEEKATISAAIVLDCSGSMNGKPMLEAKTLIAALSSLAVSGRCKGHLILSYSSPVSSSHHKLKFPISAKEIANIRSMNGGEGLEATMTVPSNLAAMREAKRVYVITDGNISDVAIDKQRMHQLGIFTTAIYVGNSGSEKQLESYFDRYYVRDTIEAIVDVLIQDAQR